MIITDFYKGSSNKIIEAVVGKYIFHVTTEKKMMTVLVYSHSIQPQRLKHFKVYPSLVLEGDGITVSFKDKAEFICYMQETFSACPRDDVKSIFETMLYID